MKNEHLKLTYMNSVLVDEGVLYITFDEGCLY